MCIRDSDNIVSVSALEFEKEIKSDSVQLVDVRTPQEYTEGHIDGASNINVQSDDFKELAHRELSARTRSKLRWIL